MNNNYSFDFDTPVDRTGTNSLKWNLHNPDELPMWVADMDFKTAPCIIEAIRKRADHGIFGYSVIPDEWNNAYIQWWSRRHNFKISPEWMVFCTGVVPAISSIVRKLTTQGEKVLVQTPVYNIFFNSIVNNGRFVVENPLIYKDGLYEMDFDDLEFKLSDPQVSLMILCNPQNPVGKIWNKETLQRIGELCLKYNVTVISDEIHCDITDPGKEYIPYASVSEICADNSITCIAPSKCFNIAGLNTASVVIPNKNLRHKVWRALNTDEVAEPNAFAVQATVAAFGKGEKWLNELNEYLFRNKSLVAEYLAKEIPDLHLVRYEATYLLWIDCRGICGDDSSDFVKYLRRTAGLWVSGGKQYGKGGSSFLRLNIACPKAVLMDGLERLKAGTMSYKCNRKE